MKNRANAVGPPVFSLHKYSPMQRLLRIHLKELGVKTIPEYRFYQERRWRFDLASEELRIGFECDGFYHGKHGAGWGNDNEKQNVAQMLGWRVLRFTNEEIASGKAKQFLQEWLK